MVESGVFGAVGVFGMLGIVVGIIILYLFLSALQAIIDISKTFKQFNSNFEYYLAKLDKSHYNDPNLPRRE